MWPLPGVRFTTMTGGSHRSMERSVAESFSRFIVDKPQENDLLFVTHQTVQGTRMVHRR